MSALLTAFNLAENILAKSYNESSDSKPVSDAAMAKMWAATGCSNPFNATFGEQPMWRSSEDGGAGDMYAYCVITQSGKASAGQLAVCGSVPGKCVRQHLPGAAADAPSKRAGHKHFVSWGKWLLRNFSLNPR